jgi:hypothetical protein
VAVAVYIKIIVYPYNNIIDPLCPSFTATTGRDADGDGDTSRTVKIPCKAELIFKWPPTTFNIVDGGFLFHKIRLAFSFTR